MTSAEHPTGKEASSSRIAPPGWMMTFFRMDWFTTAPFHSNNIIYSFRNEERRRSSCPPSLLGHNRSSMNHDYMAYFIRISVGLKDCGLCQNNQNTRNKAKNEIRSVGSGHEAEPLTRHHEVETPSSSHFMTRRYRAQQAYILHFTAALLRLGRLLAGRRLADFINRRFFPHGR
jgi:hypothetical protein